MRDSVYTGAGKFRLLVAVGVALLAFVWTAGPGAASTSTGSNEFGVVQPALTDLSGLAHAGLTRATLSVSWSMYEPAPNQFNDRYGAKIRAEAAQFKSSGIDVVLDLGLQYPPAWVFQLPGTTRFVDQYGQQWHGPTGSDVPDAVFNTAVRAAQADYIKRLGSELSSLHIVAARVGGLLEGELRYPPAKYGRSSNSLWMFSSAALSHSPYPLWRPGTGNTADAASMLAYYDRSLTSYETFLLTNIGRAFPKATMQLLMPGWGLRPGDLQAAAKDDARGQTAAQRSNDIANMTDWPAQIKALAAWSENRSEVYTTWLDASGWGTTAASESPVEYLVSLARPAGLPVTGENTGIQSKTALDISLQRVNTLGLDGMMWMSGQQMSGAGPLRLGDYRSSIERIVADP